MISDLIHPIAGVSFLSRVGMSGGDRGRHSFTATYMRLSRPYALGSAVLAVPENGGRCSSAAGGSCAESVKQIQIY
jgi:hypothetical protein